VRPIKLNQPHLLDGAEILWTSVDPDAGLIVLPDSFNIVHCAKIIELVNQHHLPAVYFFLNFARDGGLVAYGPDEIELFRRTASYVDRIFKGDSPGDLPVQHPPSSTCLSISGPPKPSDSRSHRCCSQAPTR
jgi:ABC-type uncharacterized transport system substrate-binding protein